MPVAPASAKSSELPKRFRSAVANFRGRLASGTAKQKTQAANLLARVRAIFPAPKQPASAAAILSAAQPSPVSLVAVPPSPAPLAAAATALPSLPVSAPQEPSALDPLMADFRKESDPVKRSEKAAQIIADRDAFEARRVAAPSRNIFRVANLARRSPEPVENRLPGLTAPRSVSAASALIAQMIVTQDRTERSELAGRVCASLKAASGHDTMMANYAKETDPAKRSDIAQQIIAAREHSTDLAELRSLLVQFEGAHSLETRAGIFSQVTRTARRCGLL